MCEIKSVCVCIYISQIFLHASMQSKTTYTSMQSMYAYMHARSLQSHTLGDDGGGLRALVSHMHKSVCISSVCAYIHIYIHTAE